MFRHGWFPRSALIPLAFMATMTACPPPKPVVTSVGKSVGTLVKTSGIAVGCGAAFAGTPNPVNWFAAMPPVNKTFPFAGFELFSAPQCTQARLDAYRALVTFNMGSVTNLKGLVTKAELVVSTRALPAAAGTVVTFAGFFNVNCPAKLGGATQLQRFGPAAAGAIAPLVQASGKLTVMDPDPFPTGNVVYTFPSSLTQPPGTTPPLVVAGASSPTTVSASGNGGVVFVTNVTSQVNAALNGNHNEMSWMLTSIFEGPPPAALPTGGNRDCRTAYDFDLRLTHL